MVVNCRFAWKTDKPFGAGPGGVKSSVIRFLFILCRMQVAAVGNATLEREVVTENLIGNRESIAHSLVQ